MEIIRIITYLLLGFLAVYLNTYGNLKDNVNDLITEAELEYKDTTKSGGLKFQYVVDELYILVPAPLKLIFTKTMIATLVQNAFDAIEDYAILQLNKVTKRDEQ